ncbi:hypothetical protein M5K25_011515 [Dendrobium thyrsiflorum]|uniref:Uncharacterized protein n=1 Tax=Dendrobium thyrsiflorum TaxID=117978 RepID=A0ABD0V9W7_DENTH
MGKVSNEPSGSKSSEALPPSATMISEDGGSEADRMLRSNDGESSADANENSNLVYVGVKELHIISEGADFEKHSYLHKRQEIEDKGGSLRRCSVPKWGLLLSPSTISISSSSLRISEFVLLPSPLFATDVAVWLCTSSIFFIMSRRSATCPSIEDIRSSTIVLIWFISPSNKIVMAAKKVDALEERFEGEMSQIKATVEDRISSV